MELFDTHAHLDGESFVDILPEVLQRATTAGVQSILTIGITLASSRRSVELAQAHSQLYAAVGIHPNHCLEAEAADWDEIVRLASAPRVVAIGETGLDRYWDFVKFDLQQDYFDRHLRLSQELKRPIVIHMRECEQDVLEMLRTARARGPIQGIMHSFAASEATALECLELGLYVSFAGMVTYKKSDELRRIATLIPADRLLVETDSPYLSPHPHRGQKPNEPAMVIHTAACLAAARGTTLTQLAATTTSNAKKLLLRDGR